MADENVEMLYITRFALTNGIEYRRGKVGAVGYASCPTPFHDLYVPRTQWFRDYPSALAAAEAQRAKKIASLKKQIAKLEALTFSDPSAE